MVDSTVLYIVRHGLALGNEPEAGLAPEGREQAKQLAEFFSKRSDRPLDRLISSTYERAKQTAAVVAARLQIDVALEPRLVERKLGEESNEDVANRVTAFVEELLATEDRTFLLVTHRTPMTLLLHHFDHSFGFEEGDLLTNPDVYTVTISNGVARVQDIWK